MRGPRGSKVLEGRPDAWFLAGDETAVPAMRRWAGLMDADAVGRILVEVVDEAHALPIDAPDALRSSDHDPVIVYEPGVYKGKTDPLVQRLDQPEQQKELEDRFRNQMDR